MPYRSQAVRAVAWSVVAVTVLWASPAVLAQANKRWLKTQFYAQKASAAYGAGNWEEAIAYFDRYLGLLPFDWSIHYNLACCYALNNEKEQSLSALANAIRYGWDDAEWMRQDSDLANVAGESRFAELLAEAEACHEEEFALYVPEQLESGKAPLVVALHEMGGNPREFMAYWKEAADRLGAVVVAPRAPTRTNRQLRLPSGWYAGFGSDVVDVSASRDVVERAIASACAGGKIDRARVILAGIDQGGAAALKLVAEQPESYLGAITLATLYQTGMDGLWKEAAKKRKLRVCLIVGGADVALHQSLQAEKAVKDAGHEVKVVQVPTAVHEIPAEYVRLEIDALRFVLGE